MEFGFGCLHVCQQKGITNEQKGTAALLLLAGHNSVVLHMSAKSPQGSLNKGLFTRRKQPACPISLPEAHGSCTARPCPGPQNQRQEPSEHGHSDLILVRERKLVVGRREVADPQVGRPHHTAVALPALEVAPAPDAAVVLAHWLVVLHAHPVPQGQALHLAHIPDGHGPHKIQSLAGGSKGLPDVPRPQHLWPSRGPRQSRTWQCQRFLNCVFEKSVM